MLKEGKQKILKKLWKPFHPLLQKGIDQKKFLVDIGTECARVFKKYSTAKGIQVYSTMSETKAAFAERTIRSLKSILTVTWKILGTSIYTNYLHLSLP